MNTDYSSNNQTFSDAAHKAARTAIYPSLFQCEVDRLDFEDVVIGVGDERSRIYDGEMAVDRLVSVTVTGLKKAIVHSIQERFRRPKFQRYQDLTITEWNHSSGMPSELYKLKAGIFVYGYYDADRDAMVEWLAVNTTALLLSIAAGEMQYTKGQNPRSNQSFVCCTFKELHNAKVVIAHKRCTAEPKQGNLFEVKNQTR